MFPKKAKDAKFYKGRGCPDCNFTGFKGRIAIFEIMIMNDALRGMVVQSRPSNEIKQQAIQDGTGDAPTRRLEPRTGRHDHDRGSHAGGRKTELAAEQAGME